MTDTDTLSELEAVANALRAEMSPELQRKLADKAAGETIEFLDALDRYCTLYAANVDKHVLNTAWLHVADEAADWLNCSAAASVDLRPAWEANATQFAYLGIDPDAFLQAARAQATAKRLFTALRPHMR